MSHPNTGANHRSLSSHGCSCSLLLFHPPFIPDHLRCLFSLLLPLKIARCYVRAVIDLSDLGPITHLSPSPSFGLTTRSLLLLLLLLLLFIHLY